MNIYIYFYLSYLTGGWLLYLCSCFCFCVCFVFFILLASNLAWYWYVWWCNWVNVIKLHILLTFWLATNVPQLSWNHYVHNIITLANVKTFGPFVLIWNASPPLEFIIFSLSWCYNSATIIINSFIWLNRQSHISNGTFLTCCCCCCCGRRKFWSVQYWKIIVNRNSRVQWRRETCL